MTRSIALAALVLFAVFSAGDLSAQTPRTFSYQGSLTDAAHQPVTGKHQITIKLYDAPTEGIALHTEQFDAQVENGIFTVLLGSQEALSSSVRFDRPYWLGVRIDDGAEMLPRTQLVSAPYALHAEIAERLATGAVTSINSASGKL